MSEFAARSPVSEELASFIREGIQAFCEFFKTVLIEVWYDWDPEDSALEEMVRHVLRGEDAICTL